MAKHVAVSRFSASKIYSVWRIRTENN